MQCALRGYLRTISKLSSSDGAAGVPPARLFGSLWAGLRPRTPGKSLHLQEVIHHWNTVNYTMRGAGLGLAGRVLGGIPRDGMLAAGTSHFEHISRHSRGFFRVSFRGQP